MKSAKPRIKGNVKIEVVFFFLGERQKIFGKILKGGKDKLSKGKFMIEGT